MNLNGWYVGYAIASVLIVVVVMLVAWILSLARRIGTQVNTIVAEISEIKVTTAPIPAVGKLNASLGTVVNQAATARHALVGDES